MKSLLTGIKVTAIGLAVILTLVSSVPAFATDDKKPGKKEDTIELKYRGIFKNQPVFELVFDNKEEREYTITIRDANDLVWHREKVKGVQLSRYFSLNTEEIGNRTLEFVIFCKQTQQTTVYKVDRGYRMVEDVAINKVK